MINAMIRDVVKELKLTKEQCKDEQIKKYVFDVTYRKCSNEWEQFWDGNGYCEINKNDGTLITTVLTDDDFKPEFPLNIDMNISNKCSIGCKQCYQGCSNVGKHSDIKKYLNDKDSFLYSLHKGTELAINGNEPLHPDLELLLKHCKNIGVFANLTVNEITLLRHKETLENWLKNGLIKGIGISPSQYSGEMIDFCSLHPTAVIHTIAGITTHEQYNYLANKGLKVLILGYKDFGRGVKYRELAEGMVEEKINDLKLIVPYITEMFKVVSFDNLALGQLDIKNYLTEEEWQRFYRGDDGHHTLFIDLVKETFAKNSIQPSENHLPLISNVNDMLKILK